MKQQFIKKTLLGVMLTGSLAFNACDSGTKGPSGLFTPGESQEFQALGKLTSAIEADVDRGLLTFSLALAGKLPLPLNAVGGGLIAAFWDQGPDQTTQMMSEMNAKLDQIQGTLADIQNQIANLRGQVRSDFEEVLIQNERRSIQGMADHVVQEISGSYIFFKDAGLGSGTLDEKIQILESKLAESINWFMFNGNLSPKQKSSTVAEFTILASLHIALLQEQISLYRIETYRPCPVTQGCEDRFALLTAYVTKLNAKIDRYVEYLLPMGPAIKSKRLSYIDDFNQFTSHEITKNVRKCVTIATSRYCYTVPRGTGKYKHYFRDRALAGNQLKCETIDRDKNGTAARSCRVDYINTISAQIDAALQKNLYDIADSYKAVQTQLKDIEGILASEVVDQPTPEPTEPAPGTDCVRFYKDANFGGEYADACGTGDYSWINTTLGANWNDTPSSLKLGANVSISVYQHGSYRGSVVTFSKGESVADLSASGKNNQISSFKIRN